MSLPLLYPRHNPDSSFDYSVKKYMRLFNDNQSYSDLTVEQRQLAFQLWVAYDLYGRINEESAGQLRCPLIGCSISFESLGPCLQHLTTCAWLSTSWYWCPQCQRPERFAEAGPALINRPKVEPAHKSAFSKSAAAQFWSYIRNKSCHPSLQPSLPMIRSPREVNVDTLDLQYPPGYETGFAWNPSAFCNFHSAVVGVNDSMIASPPVALKGSPYRLNKHDLLMQHPELETPSLDPSELDAWSNQRQELESPSYSLHTWTTAPQHPELDSRSQGPDNPTSIKCHPRLGSSPHNECSELQGGQSWTERWELMGSLPSYNETQYTWRSYNHIPAGDDSQPLSSWDPTVQPTFNASSSIADSPPFNNSPAQLAGPSFQPLGDVPTGFSETGQERSQSTLAINTVYPQQSTPFNQSLYKQLPPLPNSSSLEHGHERATTHTNRLERQPRREMLRWHNFPQTDPLVNRSDIAVHNNPCCSYEPVLGTMSGHDLVNPVAYLSKEFHPALRSE